MRSHLLHFQFLPSQSKVNMSSWFVCQFELGISQGRTQISCTLVMDQNNGEHGSSNLKANIIVPTRETNGGELANKCNQCEYRTSQTGHMRQHLKTHGGEKSNKCNQCDYASCYASALRTHLKTHSGEKSNICNQCDFASSHAGDLRRHLKTHSGEKSNKCNQCEYASSHAGDLRRHLKTHSVEKKKRATI